MNILKRIFKIGQAETNAAIDKLEDPIKMTEQGIRDLKEDLKKAINGLAQVKAMEIKSDKEAQGLSDKANSYLQKAEQVLISAKSGNISQQEADKLALNALNQKEILAKQVERALNQKETFRDSVASLTQKVDELKSNIHSWETEYKELKARAAVSKVTKDVNKQLSSIDSSSATAMLEMLERMKEKVSSDEAEAESYAQIAGLQTSLDQQLDAHIETNEQNLLAKSSLEEMKQKLGIQKQIDS